MPDANLFPFFAQAMQAIAFVAGLGVVALLIAEALGVRRRRALRERRQKSVEDRTTTHSLRLARVPVRGVS